MMTRGIFFLILCLVFAGCAQRETLAPVSEVRWASYPKNQKYHRVVRGETLYAIAFRYETDYRRLAELNRLRAPYSLRVGQMLRVQQARSTFTASPGGLAYPRGRPVGTQAKPPGRGGPASAASAVYTHSWSPWFWPVSGRVVTGFAPEQGKKGINIASRKGDPVRAASDGVVAYAGSGLLGYGNLIIIKHNNEFLTAYGNTASNAIVEGQQVKRGQKIAEVGVLDHKYWGVHFEIRRAGKPVNPLGYLQKG